MDSYITVQKHYARIMRDLDNEKLLTFAEMLDRTKLPPDVLRRTIDALTPQLCLYKKMKDEAKDEQDVDDHGSLGQVQDRRQRANQRDCKENEGIPNDDKENMNTESRIPSALGDTQAEENTNDNNEGILTFEELVKLTGTHPFYLERCLCNLAIADETEN